MLVAVVTSIAAGCAFALSSILQQRAARGVPAEHALSVRLLLDLARRPDWLLGTGSAILSFGLQALALAFGPLSLVQPLIVCELLFAIPISVRLHRARLGLREWAGTVAVAGGLAGFLAAAAPGEGSDQPGMWVWLSVMVSVGGVVAGCVLAGRATSGAARAGLYAAAAGATYGLLAAVLKSLTTVSQDGFVAFVTAWQTWLLGALGALGMLLAQSAFQAGPLAASLPALDAMEPTVALLIGVVGFGETVAVSPLALAGEVSGLLVLAVGIVLLDTSPVVAMLQETPEPVAASPTVPAR